MKVLARGRTVGGMLQQRGLASPVWLVLVLRFELFAPVKLDQYPTQIKMLLRGGRLGSTKIFSACSVFFYHDTVP